MIAPSQQDPLLANGSQVVGGPLGRRAVLGESWWTPLRVLTLLASSTWLLGYLMRLPCRLADFTNADRYVRMCYSDIPYLFYGRGLSQGIVPYLQTVPGTETIEYPVLTGWLMWLSARLTGTDGGKATEIARSSTFYDWTAVLLLICLIVAVVATALTVRTRPWDAAMFAVSPVVVMTGLINWDLLAIALTSVAVLLWSRNRVALAGLFLGLAISAKFYPLVIAGAVVLLCLRDKRVKDCAGFIGTAAASWAIVNVPIALAAPEQWSRFYEFSRSRGVDFGSIYLAVQYLTNVTTANPNIVVAVVLLTLTAGIAVTTLKARKVHLAQVAFLLVAAFCISNKVYSPQYALWLLPLAILARPRWRDVLIWQAGQVQYTVAVWLFLEQYSGEQGKRGLPQEAYALSIVVMILITLWFCALVIRDMYQRATDASDQGPTTVHVDKAELPA